MTSRMRPRLGAAAAICGLLIGCGGQDQPVVSVPERTFATAEEAATALITAATDFNVPELKAILGPAGEHLVATSDTVADRNHAADFAAEAAAQQHLVYDSARTSAVLNVGAENWPMPIPIIEQDGRWFFNSAAGAEEILRRRIGQNELDAITVCRGYVEAQREYAQVRHDGAQVNQYAQRVISTPGTQDGLAWRMPDGTWEGPVGEGIANVIAEGYTGKNQPFHGYYYKILKRQGPAAPLGEMDFVVAGAMIGGFALVAAPAEYGVTGIQTFIVGWDGTVYQQDMGEATLDAFRTMEVYNPDSTWTAVEAPGLE
ncbi:MAG TPA: DUF2950 domain-containing protein [Gemmatimonadales bacterium]|nr:DUF2950 domain-containing protein [Gemmatimonadales bacterium]